MKSSYSILLVIAIAILLVGFVALGISHNQEPPIATSTSPPPQVPYTPYFDSSSSGMGYRDGYYGNTYSPYHCDYKSWEMSYSNLRDYSGNLVLTYEEYCEGFQWDNDEYTQGYIDGSIDRKVEERLEEQ